MLSFPETGSVRCAGIFKFSSLVAQASSLLVCLSIVLDMVLKPCGYTFLLKETRRVKNILVDNFDKKSNTNTLDHPDPR